MPLKRLTIYISRDLEARIERIARAENRSQSAVAVEAVRARLERAPGDVPEETARRAVSRVDSRLDKSIGETLLLKEIVLLFVRVWLEHNPPGDSISWCLMHVGRIHGIREARVGA